MILKSDSGDPGTHAC